MFFLVNFLRPQTRRFYFVLTINCNECNERNECNEHNEHNERNERNERNKRNERNEITNVMVIEIMFSIIILSKKFG